MSSFAMKNTLFSHLRPRSMWSVLLLAFAPIFVSTASSAEDKGVIVSDTPMQIEADGETGAHGQLEVAPEILSAEMGNNLVYTITKEPVHGQVGMAGGNRFQVGTDLVALSTGDLSSSTRGCITALCAQEYGHFNFVVPKIFHGIYLRAHK